MHSSFHSYQTITFRKLLTCTAWMTWISIRPSAASWKHSRRRWLEVCPPQTLTHDVILSGIAPPKYTGFSPEYEPHNQVMNNFWICILLMEERQNLSSSTWKILPDAVNLYFHNLTFPVTLIPFLMLASRCQIHIKYNANSVGIAWKIY